MSVCADQRNFSLGRVGQSRTESHRLQTAEPGMILEHRYNRERHSASRLNRSTF